MKRNDQSRFRLYFWIFTLALVHFWVFMSPAVSADCPDYSSQPRVVAHRGGTELGPENRLETFRRALELKVDAIELDIHMSVDGTLFVLHDASLQRTFDHPGRVAQMSTAELRELGVPTLEEAFEVVGERAQLVIEVKSHQSGVEKALLDLLASHGLLESAIVISFHREVLIEIHRLQPSLITGFLYGSTDNTPEELQRDLGIRYLGPHYSQVDRSLVEKAHEAGLFINPWTVDDEESLERMIELGCDAITTNHPTRLLQLVARSKP